MGELGYITGVLAGDGTLTLHHAKKQSGGVHYTIRLATVSESFATKFAKIISHFTGKKVQQHRRKAFIQKFANGTYKCQEQIVVKVYSKSWFSYFSSILIRVKAGVFPLADTEAVSFVEGFYDSEGNVNRSKDGKVKSIRLFNKNANLLNLVKELLISMGFHPRWHDYVQQNREITLALYQQSEIRKFQTEIIGGFSA